MQRPARAFAVLLTLVIAGPASADWRAPEQVAGPGRYLIDLVADSAGGVLAAWGRSGTDDSAWARASADGTFGSAAPFSSRLAGRIATDGAGHAWLSWRNDEGIQVRRRGDADQVTVGPSNFRANPIIAANRRGDVAVAWRSYLDGKWLVHVAVKPYDAGWRDAATLGSGTAAQDPVVAVTDRGEVVVAWFQNGRPRRVMTATAKVGAPFGEPIEISSLNALYLRLVAEPDGRATAAWLTFTGDDSRIVAATRPASGSFGEVNTVVRGGTTDADGLGPPAVAALPEGWLLAVRRGQSVAETRVIGTDPGPERLLERIDLDGWYRSDPVVASDPQDGRALIAWESGARRLAVARRTREGAWSDVETVSPAGEQVDDVRTAVAADPVVAWTTAAGLFASRYAAPAEGDGGGGGGGGAAKDVTPPRLAASVRSRIRLGSSFAVSIRSNEHSRLRITALLRTPQRRLGSTSTRRVVVAQRTTTFHVQLPRSLRTAASRALRAHRRILLDLTVRGTDDAGNAARLTRLARVVR